jgi:2-methylcitrate dehydratase PrpD
MTTNTARHFSDFIAGTSDDLPAQVGDRMSEVILDIIAAAIAGSAAPELNAWTSGSHPPGSSPVWGRGFRSDPGSATMMNGTAGTVLEVDEGNKFARGHPGIHVVPAALAVAAENPLPGRKLLSATAIGYEVASRIGAASSLRPAVHPHGTWGTCGAAAAVARIRGLPRDKVISVVEVASGLALATSFTSALNGATIRNAYAGIAGRLGILAADLAVAGFTGESDAFEIMWGHVLSSNWDSAKAVDGLGTRWDVEGSYVKPWPCCRWTHAAIQASLDLKAEHQIEANSIRKIRVRTYADAARLTEAAPHNELAARFSIPWAVAVALINDDIAVEAFRGPALTDTRVIQLAGRITVEEDPELTNLGPALRPAIVDIIGAHGPIRTKRADAVLGDYPLSLSRHEKLTKYRNLIQLEYPTDWTDELIHLVLTLADSSTERLTKHLAIAPLKRAQY